MPIISLLDNKRTVDEEQWIIGIFHKPEGDNPQHAFLLIEGSYRGQVVFRRYDLFIDEIDPGKFNIHIQEKSVSSMFARRTLADLLKNDAIKGKCWPVARDDAARLHRYVLGQQNKPERIYNLLGDSASLPQTADTFSSSGASALPEGISKAGHNCFTWARQALLQLDIPEIKRDLPRKPMDLVVAIPSLHLSNTINSDSLKTESKCTIL